MSGRFASHLPPDAVRSLFATSGSVPNLTPNWNVAPTNNAMVIRRHPETGGRGLDLLRWGLIPSWTKDLKSARVQPINARSETAATSGMFKAALAQRRCLVPADAFDEWEARLDGKQPYAIARRDGAPVTSAGVWEWWKAPDETLLRTFAILTTSATMQQLHERMPVILEPDTWAVWLGQDGNAAMDLMRPAGDDVLHLWPVSRAVNSVRINGAELLDRVDDPNAPPPSDAPAGENPA